MACLSSDRMSISHQGEKFEIDINGSKEHVTMKYSGDRDYLPQITIGPYFVRIDDLESETITKLESKIKDLTQLVENLQDDLQQLQKKFEYQFEYAPDQPGYAEALHHFENTVQK